MGALWRGIRNFLRVYLAFFLLITAIVAVIYGFSDGGVGTVLLCLVIAAVLGYLAALVAGLRLPRRSS